MWKMGENLKMSTSEFTTFRGSLAEKIPCWEGKKVSKVRICPTLYKLIAEGKSFLDPIIISIIGLKGFYLLFGKLP